MKKIKCLKNSVASPFYTEEGIYQAIDEAWLGSIKFFRIRFSDNHIDDCPADDFVEIEEKIPDPFMINIKNCENSLSVQILIN